MVTEHASKCAVIDIGTNTVLCLIAEIKNGKIRVLNDFARIARLGEGLAQQKVLNLEARKRTINILAEYKKAMDILPPECIKVIATAGLRRASNADDFVAEVKEALNFDIEIIDGKREAYLNFLAVTHGLNLSDSNDLLIMDIGGGSTELITVEKGRVLSAESLNLGSVWITENFFKTSDPPSVAEYTEVQKHILEVLQKANTPFPQSFNMIGIAGTITTLCAMHHRMTIYDPKKVHGEVLTFEVIDRLEKKLRQLTLAEKIALPGLQKERADVLLAGAIIARTVMQEARASALIVSDQGIRYGLLWELATVNQ